MAERGCQVAFEFRPNKPTTISAFFPNFVTFLLIFFIEWETIKSWNP